MRGQVAETEVPVSSRLQLSGKFLGTGNEKVFLRGVTYGPFRPGDDGCEYKTPDAVNRDFSRIARNGINSIRTYTVPPAGSWTVPLSTVFGP